MNNRAFVITLAMAMTWACLGISEDSKTEETLKKTAQTKEDETFPKESPKAIDRSISEKEASSTEHDKFDRRIEQALKKFAHEPTLEELQHAALIYQDADLETARRWRKAPRRAALLPAIKFVVDHDLERDESLDRYQDEPDRWGADTDKDLGFQASAQWKLDELVFNSDEIRVWSALADRASRREALLTMLVGYYFERRRLQLQRLLAPSADLVQTAEMKLKIRELTASIDALTGGLLSSALKKKSRGSLKK